MLDTGKIDHGIAAHARWKYRLFDAVETGESQWTVEQIRNDTDCEFGRWLASLSPAELDSEHCRKVVELHREFHRTASEVLDLALRNEKEAAQAAMK